ncbi:hypothetical protein DPMN_008018 [Dreissena polymorpha]|uniref:Uncharacterized protein n=1 Tax=Dreissena polymorpha TaxID=45954 RepID=A0A9D4MUC5_DREPO|nr:hypothetical protein DPMN_008018 [Dreissena polymorpha]
MNSKLLMCLLVAAAVLMASAPVANATFYRGGRSSYSSDSSDSDEYNGGWGRRAGGWRRGWGGKWTGWRQPYVQPYGK